MKVVKDLYNHRISISGLNLLAKSPRAYKKYILDPRDEESEALRKGSALDCMLTEPEEFINRYAIAENTPPGGMMGEFVRHYLTYKQAAVDKDCAEDSYMEEEIRKMAYKASGFKIKLEAVIKKFEADDVQKYITFIKNSKGKTILSPMEYASALGMKEMLLNNDVTKKYLVDLPANPMITSYDQMEIIWYTQGYKCKSILDKVLIMHEDKEIIPMDIKTTSKGVGNFIQSFIKFGYFRQCSFYRDAIEYWLYNESGLEDPESWTIQPFKFIVADSTLNDFPLVYIATDKDLNVGKFGGNIKGSIKPIQGWLELIYDLSWYQSSRDWRYKKEFHKHSLEVPIDLFE